MCVNVTESFVLNLDSIASELRKQIRGDDISGWKKKFLFIDPFKGEQFVRDTKKFHPINIYLGALLYLALLAYWIFLSLEYFNSKPVTAYSLVLAEQTAPINVTIGLKCSTMRGCYSPLPQYIDSTDWNQYDEWLPIKVISTYEHTSEYDYCRELSAFSSSVRAPFALTNMSFPVCYSPNYHDGVSLSIPFNSEYGSSQSLLVSISAPSYSNKLQFQMLIEAGQEKTIFLSQNRKVVHGRSTATTYEPYVADQFYNGHQMNGTSKLTFKVQQFCYSSDTYQHPSYLTVLSDVGGISQLILPFLIMIKFILQPCLERLLPSKVTSDPIVASVTGHRRSVRVNPSS